MLQLEMQPQTQNVENNSIIIKNTEVTIKLLKQINSLNNSLCVEEIYKINSEIKEGEEIMPYIILIPFLFKLMILSLCLNINVFLSLGITIITTFFWYGFLKKENKKILKEKEELLQKNKHIGQKINEKVKELKEMNFFHTENKTIKKLKKELKIRNYWDDELFKINEGNQIDFNFRKLIKSIQNRSKSTVNNIEENDKKYYL